MGDSTPTELLKSRLGATALQQVVPSYQEDESRQCTETQCKELLKTVGLRENTYPTACVATKSFLVQSPVTLPVGFVLPKNPAEGGRHFSGMYLSFCASGATAGHQQLRRVVGAVELPKASLKVEGLVETQGCGRPQSAAVLVR